MLFYLGLAFIAQFFFYCLYLKFAKNIPTFSEELFSVLIISGIGAVVGVVLLIIYKIMEVCSL